MKLDTMASSLVKLFACLIVVGGLAAVGWWVVEDREAWPRGEALGTALRQVVEGKNPEQSLVARTILDNYREARGNASRWSGVYWGFTFTSAILSALAALVLKLESFAFQSEARKKDLAAALSVAAALLMALSTSGDFQRKWQANRIAAAELERAGYAFLEKNGAEPRTYLAQVGQILERRHLAIVGGSEKPRAGGEAGKGTQQK